MATLSRKAKPKKKSNIVKIKNDLVESFVKQNNLTALKIIFYLAYDCEKIPNGDIVKIKMNTKDICNYCNVSVKTIVRNLEQMQKTSISWTDEKKKSFVSVLPKCEIVYNGNIELTMFKEVIDMIIGVKNKYTTINAEQLMRMKSKHSARMLLLLEMINGFDEHVPKLKRYELEELNLLFGTSYKRLGEFEREVLKKAKEDLDNNSKLSFVYDINYDKDAHTIGRAKAVAVTIYLIDNQPQPTLF
jgi:plasmid replication initiation protein